MSSYAVRSPRRTSRPSCGAGETGSPLPRTARPGTSAPDGSAAAAAGLPSDVGGGVGGVRTAARPDVVRSAGAASQQHHGRARVVVLVRVLRRGREHLAFWRWTLTWRRRAWQRDPGAINASPSRPTLHPTRSAAERMAALSAAIEGDRPVVGHSSIGSWAWVRREPPECPASVGGPPRRTASSCRERDRCLSRRPRRRARCVP